MSLEVIKLNCPGCGAPVAIDQKECEYCHSPINISTFNSVMDISLPLMNKYAGSYKKALDEHPDDKDVNASMGMCYLKLKLFDKALACFEIAMQDNFDNGDIFFAAAIATLKGKIPFLHTKDDIEKCEEYINAANMITPKGIYYVLLSYIKYDYYERKYFDTNPNYMEALAKAKEYRYSDTDVNSLFAMLGVAKPNWL